MLRRRHQHRHIHEYHHQSHAAERKILGLSNCMTARALQAIGEIGGPRCCKRDTFTAVKEAVQMTKEKMGIEMELPEHIECGFYVENQQCLKNRCPYHPKGTGDF